MLKILDVSKARRSFSRILETVRTREEAVVVVRYGRPIAAIVPFARLSAEERRAATEQTKVTS